MSLSPPPPPPSTHEFHFPVLAIALIGITATGILLVTYYIYVIKCCLTFSRRRNLDTDATSATISTPSPPGLDDAVIRSIPVVNFRKSSANRKKYDGDVKSDECSNELELECAVCLCAFEEGEKLRVIPNCCHAFHIDCIDIWLQNSANCPLCRSSVSATTMLYNNPDIAKKYCNASSSRSSSGCGYNDNFSGDDDDYLVIEIQGNNLDGPRLITQKNSRNDELLEGEIKGMNKKLGRVSSMGDELIDSIRKQDEEFQVQPIRRSISMDLSSKRDFCVEIQEHCTSCNDNMLVSEVNSSNSNSSCNNKVKRSMFSFGYGRSSRGSIQPIELDP